VYRKLSEEYQTDDPIWSSTGDFIYFRVSGQSNPYARIAISLAGGFSTRSRVEVMEIPAASIRRVTHDPGSSRLLINYFPQRSVEENQFDFHIIQNLPALLKDIAPEYQ
jgi:hypothetical protein